MEAFGCFQSERDREAMRSQTAVPPAANPRWAYMFLRRTPRSSMNRIGISIRAVYAQRDEVALGELRMCGVVYGVRGIDDTFGE